MNRLQNAEMTLMTREKRDEENPFDAVLSGEERSLVWRADCLEALATMPDDSIDAILTDPPYELTSIQRRFAKPGSAEAKFGTDGAFARVTRGFMGAEWDGSGIQRNPELWLQLLRVLKPGGYALAFGGTRTFHRMVCAAEDAGFTVRNMIAWHHSQGFPKSQDVSAFIDKALGAERKVIGESPKRAAGYIRHGRTNEEAWFGSDERRTPATITEPATEEAKLYEGFGSDLKPSLEPVSVLQKPMSESTIARNVLRHGTGALNVEGCRLHTEGSETKTYKIRRLNSGASVNETGEWKSEAEYLGETEDGRFPPNAVFVHSPDCVRIGTAKSLGRRKERVVKSNKSVVSIFNSEERHVFDYAGEEIPVYRCAPGCPVRELESQAPGASKSFPQFDYEEADFDYAPFRHCSKPTRKERNAGTKKSNGHPTVKPISLMRWLSRLSCPPRGVILDPFGGSGTTGIAAHLEGFRSILLERDENYCRIARERIAFHSSQLKLLGVDE